jgi:hypothetical protein
MILKDADDRADDIAELQRLKSIAPPAFHAKIQKQIDNIYSGLEGEKSAAHFINREFGSKQRLVILHDLRIGVGGDYAQIDHLIIHHVQGAAWVLETKNFSGRLSCNEHGDWTVWKGKTPTPIPSPTNQARRHCETLRQWLAAHRITAIRDIHPVVLISPTSSIQRSGHRDHKNVVKSDNFTQWWDEQANKIGFGTVLGMIGRNALNGFTRDEMIVLGKRLAFSHVPAVYDWRSMLRLPLALDQAVPVVPSIAPALQPEIIPSRITAPPHDYGAVEHQLPAIPNERAVENPDVPEQIQTPHGQVSLRKLPDGRFALRNENNETLIEIVRKACKGFGTWNPRYRNWIIDEADLPKVLAAI